MFEPVQVGEPGVGDLRTVQIERLERRDLADLAETVVCQANSLVVDAQAEVFQLRKVLQVGDAGVGDARSRDLK